MSTRYSRDAGGRSFDPAACAKTDNRYGIMGFSLIVLTSLGLAWPLGPVLVSLAGDQVFSYTVLVFASSLYFFYRCRTHRPYSHPGQRLGGSAVMLSAGTGYLILMSQSPRPVTFDAAAGVLVMIVLWLAGGCVLCFGVNAVRSLWFPWSLLASSIPLPSTVLGWLIPLLQKGSADVAGMLFRLLRLRVYRDGSWFHLEGLSVQVAEACSGIRSTLALMILGYITGYYFLRTFRGRAMLLLLIPPLSVVKNGIRIVSVTLYALHVDQRILFGSFHRWSGVPFFLLGLALVGGAVVLLKRAEEGILLPRSHFSSLRSHFRR